MILLDFNTWWDNLTTLQMVYWIITIPASLVFIIQLVMTFIGSDTDGDGLDAVGDADLSVDSDSGVGFQFISLKNFVAFFTVFGWVGLACVYGDMASWSTVLISIISGITMMLIMASIYYFMGRLTETGTLNMKTAVGKTATVYLFIPERRKALGKVQLNIQGYRTLDAMTDDDEMIPTGSIVQVVDILNDEILLVKKS